MNPGDPGAAERFREALDAYETLIDKSRRWKYDQLRKKGPARETPHHQHQDADPRREEKGFTSLHEILEDVFGLKVEKRSWRKGTDLRFDLQISKTSAVRGTSEEIVYHRIVYCDRCHGNAGFSGAGICEGCAGKGEKEEPCSLRITVPPGSDQGTRLTFRGKGDQPAPWIRPGDLVVLLHVV